MSEGMNGSGRRSPCSAGRGPSPEVFKCAACGYEIEVWSDEQASCGRCGFLLSLRCQDS